MDRTASNTRRLAEWWPGVLFIAGLAAALFTPINPWIIGGFTGGAICIGYALVWLVKRRRLRNQRTPE